MARLCLLAGLCVGFGIGVLSVEPGGKVGASPAGIVGLGDR